MEAITRRAMFQAGATLALAAAPGTLAAQAAATLESGRETLRLWPGRPPGAEATLPRPGLQDHAAGAVTPDRWAIGSRSRAWWCAARPSPTGRR